MSDIQGNWDMCPFCFCIAKKIFHLVWELWYKCGKFTSKLTNFLEFNMIEDMLLYVQTKIWDICDYVNPFFWIKSKFWNFLKNCLSRTRRCCPVRDATFDLRQCKKIIMEKKEYIFSFGPSMGVYWPHDQSEVIWPVWNKVNVAYGTSAQRKWGYWQSYP